ncbi:MAG TPA: hypothetical protein HA240_03425 [Candidatus Thalassarchaeaceae archaeon]|nr:MAG TPA: hypothetical protein D7I04_03400 [Candidatus Poseidoniales archaeon]HIH06279.1 hypothetical protein [Candidatus Thalassarchaeaceae archaeon]
MADEQADSSSVSRVGRILDSIDSFSKNFEYSDEPQNLILENNRTIEDKIPEPVNDEAEPVIINPKSSTVVDNNTLDEKSAELIELFERIVRFSGSKLKSLVFNIQYLIPALVIFQSAFWLAYLSEDSISNGFISTLVGEFGDVGVVLLRFFSILGGLVAYSLFSSFDSQQSFDTFSLHSTLVDLIFILLIFSSILYLRKKFESLYLLFFIYVLSFINRFLEVNDSSYDWLVMFLVILISMFLLSIVSIPLTRNKIIRDRKESRIDLSVLKKTSLLTEDSYRKPNVGISGSSMDQAPVTKPRRPSRRSEYELYEWVLLLANLILWPAVFFISIILGSGIEMYGNSYNMDENYLMLMGPLFLTLFFFGILFKMDKNARDGSLYAAEKQSYLEEMDKYLKARTAYLELVTLQAETKKQEIVSSSEE